MLKSVKSVSTVILAVLIVFASFALGSYSADTPANAAGKIDNSSLVTKWVPDSQCQLDEDGWPTWTKDLVMAECRIETASTDGTVKGMTKILKHFAETGVNGLWVTPLEDKGMDTVGSTYCAYGPHTVNPYITGQIKYGEPWHDVGEKGYAEGRKILKQFVDECHKYNIRIFFDKVPWGVSKVAPIAAEHPEWFKGNSSWGGLDYNMNNEEMKTYYYDSNVQFIMETGCDGIRWDLEPSYFGYEFIEEMHMDLVQNYNRKVLFFSEDQSFHGKAYAFEQCYGVNGSGVSSQYWTDCFFNDVDIVEAVQTGAELGHRLLRSTGESGQSRYYTYQITSHDVLYYHEASPAAWGYQFLYGSFIPLFYVGEEVCAHIEPSSCYGAPVYGSVKYEAGLETYIPGNQLDKYLADAEHAKYFEEVKELISYRWKYKDIVNKSTENHRDTNICTVKLKGSTLVQGYARYHDNKGFIVVPNVNEGTTKDVKMTVAVPLAPMKLSNYTTYTVTNIRTGKTVVKGSAKDVATFTDTVKHDNVNLYLVTAEGKINKPKSDSAATDDDGYYDSGDDDDIEIEDEDFDDGNGGATKKAKKRYKLIQGGEDGLPLWAIIAIIAGGVIVLGGGTFLAIFLAKKKKAKGI